MESGKIIELKSDNSDEQPVAAAILKGSKKILYTALVGEDLQVKVYDCAKGESTKVATFSSGYSSALDRVPCLALSDTEAICYAIGDTGSPSFYKVNISSGAVTKVLDQAKYAGYSPDGRYIAYTPMGDKEKISLFDLSTGQTTAQRDTGAGNRMIVPIWSLDSSRLMLYYFDSFEEVDMHLNPVGEKIAADTQTILPVFVKNGIWYYKPDEFTKRS